MQQPYGAPPAMQQPYGGQPAMQQPYGGPMGQSNPFGGFGQVPARPAQPVQQMSAQPYAPMAANPYANQQPMAANPYQPAMSQPGYGNAYTSPQVSMGGMANPYAQAGVPQQPGVYASPAASTKPYAAASTNPFDAFNGL